MYFAPEYVLQLEELVKKLLPIYDEYYQITGKPKPDLDPVVKHLQNKVPALLKKGF